MAHKTLESELKLVNDENKKLGNAVSSDNLLNLLDNDKKTAQADNKKAKRRVCRSISLLPIEETENSGQTQNSLIGLENDYPDLEEENKVVFRNDDEEIDTRVDKVYTVGCFDIFHHGHVRLIERMREVGKKVIIGVHDSRRYLPNSFPKITFYFNSFVFFCLVFISSKTVCQLIVLKNEC